MDFPEFKRLCEQRGIVVDEDATSKYKDGANAVVDIGIPLLGRMISPFIVYLTKSIPEGQRLYDFRGGYLWLGEIGLWDPDLENSSKLMFESLRPGRETIESARGQAYRADEFVPFHAALTLVLLTGWDALVVLDECDYLVMISHDEYVRLVFRDQKLADEVQGFADEPDSVMVQRPPWRLSKAVGNS